MTTQIPVPYAEFAARFDALLEIKANGNRSECARALGVTPQAVSKWASGVQLPRGTQMEKLADWLGTTAAHLRFGDGAPPQPTPTGPRVVLMYVDADWEVPLLNDFRLGTERGKKQLLASARRMEKVAPEDRPASPDLHDD